MAQLYANLSVNIPAAPLSCTQVTVPTLPQLVGQAIVRADSATALLTAAVAIAGNTGFSTAQRQLANCAIAFLKGLGFVIAPTASQFSLLYVCGNRFLVRNTAQFDYMLNYQLGSGAARDTIPVSRKPGNGPYSELTIIPSAAGTVKLYYKTTLLKTTANGNTVCP
jgi:hypothetical protein